MNKRNGRAKIIHTDRFVPSSLDCRALAVAIEERFLIVCELYGRQSGGEDMPIPKWMEAHLVRWRMVVVRHRKGDHRHTESEWQSMKEMAQFTVDVICRLRGQEPKRLVWAE